MDSVDKFIHSNYAFHVTQGKLKPHIFELDQQLYLGAVLSTKANWKVNCQLLH